MCALSSCLDAISSDLWLFRCLRERAGGAPEEGDAIRTRFLESRGLLLTSADPTGGGGVVAGYADQRNLELLVEVGFTPVQAIQIATQNGAIYEGCRKRRHCL